MTDQPRRFAGAIGLAGAAGALEGGLHTNIPVLVQHHSRLRTELAPAEIGLIMSALTLLSLVATIGVFLSGYWWTKRAEIPAAYGRFAVSLAGAAIIGFGVGYLVTLLLLADLGQLPNEVLPTIGDVGRAARSVIGILFVGLAGGAIAQYRSVSGSSWRQWPGNGDTARFGLVVGLAGVAGFLHSLGPNVLPVLMEYHSVLGVELVPRETGRILTMINSTLTLLSLTVTIGIFLAGYAWGRRTDVPAAYGYFAVSLFVATIIGLGVGLLTMFLLLSDQPWLTTVGLFGAFVVSSISVPIPGLAGGAIAQYRSVTDAL